MELPGFNQLTTWREGVMLYNRNDLYAGRMVELYGEFCQGEVALLEQIVRPGAVVIDAGANIGALTLPLSRMVGPSGVVVAIEPDRLLFQVLCANAAINSRTNIVCRHELLTDCVGFTRVPCMDANAVQHFGGLSDNADRSKGEIVKMTTVDEIGFKKCDVIKADVEGMELQVLKGAQKTIERLRPYLYLENNPGDKREPLIKYVDSLGYEMYWHVTLAFNPNNYRNNPNNVYGEMHSNNMICVPAEKHVTVLDLPRVASDESFAGCR